jgi:hypothetical protein
MNGLYPIIRRVRRPLLPVEERPVVPAPSIENPGPEEKNSPALGQRDAVGTLTAASLPEQKMPETKSASLKQQTELVISGGEGVQEKTTTSPSKQEPRVPSKRAKAAENNT